PAERVLVADRRLDAVLRAQVVYVRGGVEEGELSGRDDTLAEREGEDALELRVVVSGAFRQAPLTLDHRDPRVVDHVRHVDRRLLEAVPTLDEVLRHRLLDRDALVDVDGPRRLGSPAEVLIEGRVIGRA